MSDITLDQISIQVEGNSDKAIESLNKLVETIDNLTKSTSKGFFGLEKTNKKIQEITNNAKKNTKKLNTDVKKNIGGIVKEMAKIGFATMGIGESIKQAVQYTASISQFNSTLNTNKEILEDAANFVNKLTDAWYLNEKEVMSAMSSYYSMTNTMGIASKDALRMSKNLTMLTQDLAAWKQVETSEVMNQIASGLRGEAEGLSKFGIFLNQATLQSVLYANGIDRTVSSLTAAQKAELIYYQIMKQTQEKQGYLTKTLLEPANALKTVKTLFVNLAQAIGSIFIPILQVAAPYIMLITNLLNKLAKALASLLGFELGDWGDSTEQISSGISNIGDSAEGTSKKVKGMLADFDELHTIDFGDNSGSGSATGGSGGSLGLDASQFEYDLNNIEDPLAELKEKFLKPLESISFDNLSKSIENLKNAIQPLLQLGWDSFYWAYLNILVPLSKFTIESLLPNFLDLLAATIKVLTPILEAVVEAGKNFFNLFIKPIAEFVGGQIIKFIENLTEILTDFSTWVNEHQQLVEQFTFLILTLGTAFLLMHSPVAAIVAVVILAITVFNEFYENNKELVKTILAIVAGIATAVVAFQTISKVLIAAKTSFSILKVAITGVQLVLAVLTSPIGIAIAAITALIAAGVLLYKNWDTIKGKLKELVENTIGKFNEMKNNVSNKIEEIKTNASLGFEIIKTDIGNKLQGMKENAINKFIEMGTEIYNKIEETKKNISDTFENIKNTISDKIENAKTTVKNGIEAIKGFFKFEWSLPEIKTPHISWETEPASGWIADILSAVGLPTSIPKMKIDWYEDGGFPTKGDLFFANENGKPEWVSTMNGRTAVANKDQITTGVRQAAYEGMSQALAEYSGGGTVIYNYLDSKEIASKMTRVKKSNDNMYG